MGTLKIRIATLFLLFLFLQRMGGAMFLKVCIHEHVYKELKIPLGEKKSGKVKPQKLICPNNRIFEECQSTFEVNTVTLPTQNITYLARTGFVFPDQRMIGTFLKKSSLRGPPVKC